MAARLFNVLIITTLVVKSVSAYGYSAGSVIWSRSYKNFIPIEKIATFQAEREKYLRRSLELETHNFQKGILKLAYYEERNIVHFYDNNTKITGVFGELWNTLAEYLNFTMVPVRTKDSHFGVEQPNGSYSGLLGMLTRDEVQIIPKSGFYVAESKAMRYITPVWYNSYRLYIRPESKANGAWFIYMFSKRVWWSLLALFSLLSIFGYAMQKTSIKVSGDKHAYHSLHDHFFYTFGTICCQGFIPDSLYRRMKILGFSKKMFAWLLLMTISSHLISWTTNQKVHPPFDDLGTMFNETSYNVVVFNGSIVFEKFKKTVRALDSRGRYKDRINYVKSPQRLYEKGCWGRRKYAIFDSEDRQRAFGRLQCNLAATGVNYYPTWVSGGVSKTFKYKRTLDLGILKLNEVGLTDGLKDHWMATNSIETQPVLVKSITFMQVWMLFGILVLGIIASAVICIFENFFFLYLQRKRRNVKRRKTFYPAQGKILF